MEKGDVIQFNENHKWCGVLGIIEEVKPIHNEKVNADGVNDFRYMVAVPVPRKGTSYIYVAGAEHSIELIGRAILVPHSSDDDNE